MAVTTRSSATHNLSDLISSWHTHHPAINKHHPHDNRPRCRSQSRRRRCPAADASPPSPSSSCTDAGCGWASLSLASLRRTRIQEFVTHRIDTPSPLLDLVRDELPLGLVHLGLHLLLGFQQFRTVFGPDDGEVVLQTPVSHC